MSTDSLSVGSGLGLAFALADDSQTPLPDLEGEPVHCPDEEVVGHDEPTTPPRIASPSIPSPLSLHHLGIIPLSPLRRQFSSPLAQVSPPRHRGEAADDDQAAGEDVDEDEDEDEDEDRKDVLVQRLNDLTQRLSSGAEVGDDLISVLHAKVDEMERVLAKQKSLRRKPRSSRPPSIRQDGQSQSGERHDSFWASPSPSLVLSRVLDLPPSSPAAVDEPPAKPPEAKSAMSLQDALRIASEAEMLNGQLSDLVTNLKARHEETEVRCLRDVAESFTRVDTDASL
jgi:hypothetical protein